MPQNITSRQIEILYELLNVEEEHKYITNSQLSEQIGVSRRTIRRELKILAEYFKNRDNIRLIKKRGQGTRLLVNQKQKMQLIELYQKRQKNSIYIEPEKRKIKIIYYLLNNSGFNDINILEKELNISSSTLNRDLKEVEKFLKKYDLLLISNDKARKIYGSEFKKRILTVNIILEILPEEKQYKLLSKLKKGESLKIENYNLLEELNLLSNLNKLSAPIFDIQKNYDLYFTTNSFLFLLIYLACSIERGLKNKRIESIDNLSIFNNKLVFPKSFVSLTSQFYKEFPQFNEDNEKSALFILFLFFSNFNKDEKKLSYLNSKIKKLIKDTSEKIINTYKDKLSKNIKLDNQFAYMHLQNYLINIILNNKFNLNADFFSIQKHELKKIIDNNPYTFYLAESFKDTIEKNLSTKLNDIELYYLGILFLKFMESEIQTLRALIIHDNNFNISNLIKNRLQNSFKNITFTSKNYFSTMQSDLKKYDLIIATKYFAELETAIIISPLINTADRKKIEEKIKVISDLKRFIN
jgi:transcriptional antiterminator